MNKPLFECKNITKKYHDGSAQISVLNQLNLTLSAAENVAIVGSSGSGKSSLLHIMGTLDAPTEGQILFKGQDIHQLSERKQALFRNQNLGFVYQFHHLLGEFNALENVVMPLLIAKQPLKQAEQQAKAMLERVGLSHRLKHKPSELSGGERQRVAIARALVHQPDIVLADEPTGNLDAENAAAVFDLILQLKNELSTCFVFVTHDLNLANKMDRQLKLKQGLLFELNAEVVEHD
ncbi:lipoprotein-releasing ABC transporter ATP-binding protein LolD [Catenovulum sp. 2E275]|uniref:lipoprotein-releasing ABC transporter ATP-binding protein LolD n=1 Tax=Catenovulum sp. 2E275 TaxID=2980497 RepID=UPI0021CED9E0|nr:lipoprotein-releasing ABC transporter ATP-binding protein LolD [Catenovulum sp. 2E275]MCU4675345.1 lipoprotein-releasing ABC transporter ATP-binding protein LolD [Catenovulum sp. 2E275]